MRYPLRTLVVCCVAVLASACVRSVAGTAEVNQEGAAAISSSNESSPMPLSGNSQPSAAAVSAATTSVRRTLSCSAGALMPSAGTFCYQIPAGFVDGSATATFSGSDPVHSAIQIQGTGRTRDLIFVTSTVLDVNSDHLDDAVIEASLANAYSASPGAARISVITRKTVAGDRAFEALIKFADGVQQRYLEICWVGQGLGVVPVTESGDRHRRRVHVGAGQPADQETVTHVDVLISCRNRGHSRTQSQQYGALSGGAIR